MRDHGLRLRWHSPASGASLPTMLARCHRKCLPNFSAVLCESGDDSTGVPVSEPANAVGLGVSERACLRPRRCRVCALRPARRVAQGSPRRGANGSGCPSFAYFSWTSKKSKPAVGPDSRPTPLIEKTQGPKSHQEEGVLAQGIKPDLRVVMRASGRGLGERAIHIPSATPKCTHQRATP
jgi:hypothetical protein